MGMPVPDTDVTASPGAGTPAATPTPAASPREAVLLVNLGSPSAPSTAAVWRFLASFLGDRRVVQLPRWLWLPLLHGVILPWRSPRTAKKYAAIWTFEGSPLAVNTQRLAASVQARLPDLRVRHAMRYGEPALARELLQLRAEGVERVLVLPLYPQYSTTTTASIADVLARQPGPEEGGMHLRLVDDYHRDPGWVAAVAASIGARWRSTARGDKLLFSFHGIPQRLVDAGDPYERQCRASVAAIAQVLGLREEEYQVTFQSRFGKERWLQPDTRQVLQSMARRVQARVDVVCPGFAVDCLETLEEIAMRDAQAFQHAGGEQLRYIPCLNDDQAHGIVLAGLARRELQAWR